jgi:hypothetical protein
VKSYLPVFIASEAKQSISPDEERMDCFVASLFAMTWIGCGVLIARSRLRKGFAEASLCWLAEALAEAASRATTNLLRHCERQRSNPSGDAKKEWIAWSLCSSQ